MNTRLGDYKQQQGFSLLELLLVLGFLVMMLAVTFSMYHRFSFATVAKNEHAMLSATLAGLRDYTGEGARSPQNPSTQELLQAGIIVQEQVTDGQWVSTQRNPVGLYRKGTSWAIDYTEVYAKFCEHLIGEVLSTDAHAFASIQVNGAEVLNGPEGVVSKECLRYGDTRRGGGSNQVRFVLAEGPGSISGSPMKPAVKNKRWGTNEEI